MLRLYNTLTKKVEEFVPLSPPLVGLYTCGMTVYDYAHIGHGRKYVGDDILRRVLTRFGYEVKHVQNVTDVGHLSSDADEGEDKLEKGAAKTGKTVWEVAEFFTKHFYDSMDTLNILRPDIICKATEHIPEQISLIGVLLAKGFAYDTPEAVYFDVSKFAGYGKLFGQKLEEKKVAVRGEVETGSHKKHPADFAAWFKRVGRFAGHTMHWESPWGDGFPGWHIECSAMSMKYLGETIDIHTGGIDHIPIHHPNEIAQSEAATGKQFVRFWVHHAFFTVDGQKMSKSLGNVFTIEDVETKGFDPLSLRYFYMTAHYRKPMNFTWEALRASQQSLDQLRAQISNLKSQISKRNVLSQEKLERVDTYRRQFNEVIADDLNMPQALAVVWEVVKSNIPSCDKYDLLVDFDEVLGLRLSQQSAISNQQSAIPEEVQTLVDRRELLRQNKQFDEADALRGDIEAKGYIVEDTPMGVRVKKNEKLKSSSIFHPRESRSSGRRRSPLIPGLIVLFGSGEMSPTGRKIHENVLQRSGFAPPVTIGILETPTGYEVNAIHGWPERMEQFFRKGLRNFHPEVTRIRAWRNDGPQSTNDPKIVDAMRTCQYIYCGAGSPSYTIKHLKNTRAYENLIKAHKGGAVLSLGSATAVAIGKTALPVYEIFKVGSDPHWLDGLDFFSEYGLELAIVPHWNNQEGEDFDTTRCWMGQRRFAMLRTMLPTTTIILGIDEQTACIVDIQRRIVDVAGVGNAYVQSPKSVRIFPHGSTIPFSALTEQS